MHLVDQQEISDRSRCEL